MCSGAGIVPLEISSKLGTVPLEISSKLGTVPLEISSKLGTVPLEISSKLGTVPLEISSKLGTVPLEITCKLGTVPLEISSKLGTVPLEISSKLGSAGHSVRPTALSWLSSRKAALSFYGDILASKVFFSVQPTCYCMCADLECLYRFKESDYHNPIAEPPEPAFVIRGITPTPSPPPSRPASSRHSARHGAQSSTRRPKSVPVPKFRPVPKVNIPTPMQAWKNSLAETSWGVVTPGSTPAPQPATPQPPSGGQEEKVSGLIVIMLMVPLF